MWVQFFDPIVLSLRHSPRLSDLKGEFSMLGTVKWYNAEKRFGFIESPEINEDIFVHQSEIRMAGFRKFEKGEVVDFVLSVQDSGFRVLEVTVLGKGTLKLKEVSGKIVF